MIWNVNSKFTQLDLLPCYSKYREGCHPASLLIARVLIQSPAKQQQWETAWWKSKNRVSWWKLRNSQSYCELSAFFIIIMPTILAILLAITGLVLTFCSIHVYKYIIEERFLKIGFLFNFLDLPASLCSVLLKTSKRYSKVFMLLVASLLVN